MSKEVGDKFDKDKNRLDLIPAEAIEAAGWILTHGAKKYTERNWQKGIKYGKIYGALQRHLKEIGKRELNMVRFMEHCSGTCRLFGEAKILIKSQRIHIFGTHFAIQYFLFIMKHIFQNMRSLMIGLL